MSNWLAYTSAATLAAALIGAAGFAVPGLGVISAEAYSKSLVRYAPPGDADGGQILAYAGDPRLPGAPGMLRARTFVLIVEIRRMTPEGSGISSDGGLRMQTQVTVRRLRDI
ncbi:MAG: hypothetical protein ACREH6_02550 [Geminicoccaceae bacterium]